jgi:hypothetical protein
MNLVQVTSKNGLFGGVLMQLTAALRLGIPSNGFGEFQEEILQDNV